MSYCIYLRKSRKDLEAEQHGEGETLARHERALLSLAKKNNLIISNIYREVVSGETIAARPVMQQLLREVEQNLWDGVLVMEVERLARGDTIDQGVVQRAFQYSNTLIITPSKTYDPANEFDEEYFEFGLFMSRREYKTIKRRMQNGRYAAISEGKWPYNSAPYGFRRTKLEKEKGWTLAFDENEAPVVRLIFSMFTGPERVGIRSITRTLNSYGTKPRNSKLWSESTVRGILSNVVYDQCVKIGERKVVRTVENGVLTTTRPRTSDYTIVSGRHPRLIDHDVFAEAQSYLGCGSPKPAGSNIIKNPLAGIIVCSECKKKMIRRSPSGTASRVPYDLMLCSTYDCPTIGSPLDLVEREVYNALSDWVEGYRLSGQTPSKSLIPEKEVLLESAQQTLDQLLRQKGTMYDLLEQGVYSTEVFLERSASLQSRISEAQSNVAQLKLELDKERQREANIEQFLPACEDLLSCYWDLSIPERNRLLKLLIESIEYKKLTKNKRGHLNEPNFELTIKPRIPRK